MSAGSSVPAPVRLRPELLDDLTEAFGWYEAQAEGVGHDFTRAFFAAVARAAREPRLARPVYAGFRRVRVRRLPHSLYYPAEASETVFFLLFHGARDPQALRRTLRARRSAPPNPALERTPLAGHPGSAFHACPRPESSLSLHP